MNVEDVKRALPWYAAGAIGPEEAAAIETELKRSPELQRELHEWQAIGSLAATPQPGEPELPPSVFEATWARIERHERSARDKARDAARAHLLDWLRATWFGVPTAGRWALAAQFALIVVLGGALEISRREPSSFTTLSGGTAASTAAAGSRLTVAFELTATQADVQALLAAIGAQIVAGPSSEQIYTLELRERSAAATDSALSRLRAARGTVRFAARDGD